jgi:predicted nicotinamide N-methyase
VGRQPRAVAPALMAIAVLSAGAAYGLLRDRDPATLNNVAFAALHIAVLLSGVSPALRREPLAAPRPRSAPVPA